jgi:hypothetical protein
MSIRSEALAIRLEQGARALALFARELTDEQWQLRMPGDGRKFGVIVHHVGNMYPIEIELAQTLSRGLPVTGVTWDVVAGINADHAVAQDGVTKAEALALLLRNSEAAATAIRAFDDRALDNAAPVSLYGDAPLTCQFFVEDHALRHSYHHLANLRRVLAHMSSEGEMEAGVVALVG